MTRRRSFTEHAVELLLAVLLISTVAVAGLARIVPATGHPVLIIRTGSMTPAIPVGAAVVLDPEPSSLQPGEVVAIRLDDGTIFTHRITRLVSLGGVSYIETQGDRNATVDPALMPLDRVVGRVALTLPAAGYLISWLGSPVGVVTVLFASLMLLAAWWLLDDEGLAGAPQPVPVPARTREHAGS